MFNLKHANNSSTMRYPFHSVRYLTLLSIIIFLASLVDSVGSLLGLWSILGDERPLILLFKAATLIALLFNSWRINRWVIQNSADKTYHYVAWLCTVGLINCLLGDVVNFNLSNDFYLYEGIVKHDYLANSIFFFFPGYSLLLIAGIIAVRLKTTDNRFIFLPIMFGGLFGMASMSLMHLPHAGWFVSVSTSVYAVLIGIFGLMGISIMLTYRAVATSFYFHLVGMGFILASLADAIIGNFWIYGNNGEGYYPNVRYVNWIIYITSHCLVIYLPKLLVINLKYSHDKHIVST